MRVFAPFLLSLLAVISVSGQQSATPANVVCFQEIIGSNSNYAAIDASVSAWASKLTAALGLSGDVHQYVDWAQVKDRNSFENGCDGPYQTVADVYVHIQTTSDNFDSISAALETFIAANAWSSQPNIACGARSVVTYLPGCGKVSTPTVPRGGSGTSAPTPSSSPSNVVCYQTIIGSSGTEAQVDTAVAHWANGLTTALSLSGDVHQWVDWALVPDRTSFENGCNGPYAVVVDVFAHIQTTNANFNSMSSALEAYIAAHPITGEANVACAARSVTTFLPTCGQSGSGTGSQPTQGSTSAPTPTQAATTTKPTEAATSAPTESLPTSRAGSPTGAATSAPTEAATSKPTEASTSAPTQAAATSKPTQAATSAPTEAATSKPTSGSSSTSAPTEAATSKPTEAATSAPTEATTSKPTQGSSATSAPTEAATSKPTQAATSAPSEAATSKPTQVSSATSSPTESLPTSKAGSPTEAPSSGGEQPSPNNILCYQEIIGSNSNYATVDASISAWANKLEAALGFSGDVHQYVDWAQVKDRTGFENGCDGPYQTVADVFVHIETTSQAYDDLSSKMEAFISANGWTSQPSIACGARSNVQFLPGCGKLQTGPSFITTAPPTTSSGSTSAPSSGSTSAPSSGSTSAPSSGSTSAPSSGSTSAPSGSNSTSAPSSGSTEAPTSSPSSGSTSAPSSGSTSAPTSSPSSGPTEIPTPNNVVCYQSIFGANVAFANVSATIEAWANRLEKSLGLSGDVHAIVDWSQVPDRTSFENCNGPYQTVADVFVHIPTTAAGYDALSLSLESFVLANPLTAESNIVCSARSVTTFLPTCGKLIPKGGNPTGNSGNACYQSIVGSSSGTWAQVDAELGAWASNLQSSLGLSGNVHQYIDWAQVPDRTSFENGCNGPYKTVADIFVHIPATSANYNTLVANINSFTSTNSLKTNSSIISCTAVSDTSVIPICGLTPVATDAAAGDNTNTNTYPSQNGAATITITGSVIVTIVTLLFGKF